MKEKANAVLEEMANALTLALTPSNGEPLLSQVARYRRHLVKTGFDQRVQQEEYEWNRNNKLEKQEQKKVEVVWT